MKAEIKLNLTTSSPEEGQRILNELCEKLIVDKAIDGYSFDIHTEAGIVTEKCILSQGAVIA